MAARINRPQLLLLGLMLPGVDDCLAKPVHLEALRALIDRF